MHLLKFLAFKEMLFFAQFHTRALTSLALIRW